jgi:hypothetical protein
VPLAEVGSTGRTGYLTVFPVLPCVSLHQVGMLLRAEPGWTCPDMEVEICGRYGKSPVESDLGIISAAKLAECFKFQIKTIGSSNSDKLPADGYRRSLKQMIVFSRT